MVSKPNKVKNNDSISELSSFVRREKSKMGKYTLSTENLPSSKTKEVAKDYFSNTDR